MKNLILFVLNLYFGIVSVSVFAATNNPNTEQKLIQNVSARTSIDLNGWWNIIIDPYENGYYNHRYEPHEDGYFRNEKAKSPASLVEYNFATTEKLRVPGDWNTQQEKLMLYEGTIWYQKDFSVNKKPNKNYIIHFGAVNYKAIVYINGTKVGEHEGGFTPFNFNISHLVRSGNNYVVVKVDSRRERNQVPTVNTDWWNYGGITRSVAVMELDSTYLQDYSVKLHKKSTNQISISVQLKGQQNLNKQSVLVEIPELNVKQRVRVDNKGQGQLIVKRSPQLWSPKQPKLYDISLIYNGSSLHDRIGFRNIATHNEDILLNGKSIFLRGISIHEESPLTNGRAWSEADAKTLLGWAKELGANFVRLAHYPHNENMLKVADEIGLLVWSEIPVYWTVMFEDKQVFNNAKAQLSAMINRDKNRASIIMWSMANETPMQDARLKFIANLAKEARSIDHSRLITAAMDTQSTSEHGMLIEDPLSEVVDVIGINSYCGWYFASPSECKNLTWESHNNKPIIMSEMGAGAKQGLFGDENHIWTEEYQASVYRNNIDMIKNMPALRGMTPWILKDFRSPRRPLNGIQDFWNRKGLLSELGVKKQAWFVLHDFYQQLQVNQ